MHLPPPSATRACSCVARLSEGEPRAPGLRSPKMAAAHGDASSRKASGAPHLQHQDLEHPAGKSSHFSHGVVHAARARRQQRTEGERASLTTDKEGLRPPR